MKLLHACPLPASACALTPGPPGPPSGACAPRRSSPKAPGHSRCASFRLGPAQAKRRRAFNGAWAQRWRCGAKTQAPAEPA